MGRYRTSALFIPGCALYMTLPLDSQDQPLGGRSSGKTAYRLQRGLQSCLQFYVSMRVVLITGGCRGIGLATASLFARQGCSVIVTSRSLAVALEAAAALPVTEAHGRHHVRSHPHPHPHQGGLATANASAAAPQAHLALECDVGDAGSIERAAASALSTYGRVDVLVNCAGEGGCR